MNHAFQSGEVIRARMTKFPVAFHYGIIVHHNNEDMILHNASTVGNPRMDTVQDFFKERYFDKSYGKLTDKTDQQLIDEFQILKYKKYSFFQFNCEDFVNRMIGYFKFQGGKIQLGIGLVLASALIVIAIKKMANK